MHSFVCNRALKAACKALDFSVSHPSALREQRQQ